MVLTGAFLIILADFKQFPEKSKYVGSVDFNSASVHFPV